MGSFLCGQSEPYWINAIKRLKTIPLKATLERLKISYNGLEEDYKELFLDVACILRGWEKNCAIRILESRGFHAEVGLRVLEQRSLITYNKYGVLWMHDHLEEMGRNIDRGDDPQRHSRLWDKKEIEHHYNIKCFSQRKFGAFPGDLSPVKRRWETLVRDSFPSNNP
nr:Toll/interleukin-1 receptor (TIR) domain-containing protein [Tanacetum cinerariifolium]